MEGLVTEAIFDQADGSYSFISHDVVNFPPGDYQLEITGTSGSLSESFIVNLKFVNPCNSEIELQLRPMPFNDETYVLYLQSPEWAWTPDELVFYDHNVNCGSFSFEFFNSLDMGSPLESELFLDDRSNEPDNIFKVLYSENVALKGSYPIRYRAWLTDYSDNEIV